MILNVSGGVINNISQFASHDEVIHITYNNQVAFNVVQL